MSEDELHRITIHSYESAADLVHQIRDRAREHIRGNVQLRVRPGERIIELVVDDVEPVRRVVEAHGDEDTSLQVDFPTQRVG